MVCQMDLFASMAALVGESYESETDSEELLDVLLGNSELGRESLIL